MGTAPHTSHLLQRNTGIWVLHANSSKINDMCQIDEGCDECQLLQVRMEKKGCYDSEPHTGNMIGPVERGMTPMFYTVKINNCPLKPHTTQSQP